MEYQKMINLLINTINQPSKFKTKNWVEINDNLRECVTPVVKLNVKVRF